MKKRNWAFSLLRCGMFLVWIMAGTAARGAGDPFAGTWTADFWHDLNIQDGIALQSEKITFSGSRVDTQHVQMHISGDFESVTLLQDGDMLSMETSPLDVGDFLMREYDVMSDGVNGACVIVGEEYNNTADLSANVILWTSSTATISPASLAGYWRIEGYEHTNLRNITTEPFESMSFLMEFTPLGGNLVQMEAVEHPGYSWVFEVNGNRLSLVSGHPYANDHCFEAATDGSLMSFVAITTELNDPTDVSVMIALGEKVSGVDLSGEYWFGSLSADVSTNIPWGKQGTVVITGDSWTQEWDDQSGHHTFSSAFTTAQQPDGSLNIELSSGTYNVAWNGNVIIHADTAPDGNNRLGIDILIRKATAVQSSDLLGEYGFFGHKLSWDYRADSVDWGQVIFNANGTASCDIEGVNGYTFSGTVNWSLDTINALLNIPGKPSSTVCQNGIVALSLFEELPGDDPDFGFEFFIKKTAQTITRAEMADTYQMRFLESGPGGVPYTCGQGTCTLHANGTFSTDAYFSDGEHVVNSGSFTVGPGNTFTITADEENIGIISPDKGLILIPEMDRPGSPGPDDWIGGIFLIRAPSTAQQFQLTASVVGGLGTLSPSGGSYDSGTVVNLTATPEAGCWVKAWHGTDEDGLTSTANTVTMTADKTVTVEFEQIPEDVLTISLFTVKAGKTRDSHTDSLALRGSISPEFLSFIADPVNNLADITLGVYSQQDQNRGILQTLDSSYITVDAKRTKIACKAPAVTGQPALVFSVDLKKGAFSLTGKNLDLTGLESPVVVELKIGNYTGSAAVYDGEVSGSGGNPDLINGAKPIPVQFMVGYADMLGVDKCVFVLGTKKPQTDKLTIQGALAVADPSVDIAALDMTVQWGTYSVVLPAADIIQLGVKKAFKYVKPKGAASPIAAALFDLEKCTFKIAIAKADIGPQSNPVDFSIQFGAFHESITLPLTQKNQTASVYP